MEQQSASEYCPRCQVLQPTFQFEENGASRRRCQACGFPVEAALAKEPHAIGEAKAHAINVLCVDDDPLILQMLADILRFHGYTVETAPDGEAGLEAAARVRPDVILLDVMMPGIDGFEVCRLLKADPAMKAIPVIFLTAMNDPALNAKAFEAGAVLAMQKTADTKAVTRTIEAAIALSDRTASAAETTRPANKARATEGEPSATMPLTRATFWTEDGATFEGSLSPHPTAGSRGGLETILDSLNAPDRFMVVSIADDSPVVLLNKTQIIRVDVPSDSAAQVAEAAKVSVRLINGEQLVGTVRVEGGGGRQRLSGLLNAEPAFLPLQGHERLHLLQKRFVSRIIPQE